MAVAASIRVGVVALDGSPIRNAAVTIEGGGRLIQLALTPELGGYAADDVPPGSYTLVVAAAGLASEQRPVVVDEDGTDEMVVLGRPGLPHYYRGAAKVPFEPLPLLGVSFRGTPDVVEQNARALAVRFELEEMPVDTSVSSQNIRVYRPSSGQPTPGQPSILNEIRKSDASIRHVGPLVAMRKDLVVILTDEFIIKFKGSVTADEVNTLANQLGCTVLRPIPYAGNAFLVQTPDPFRGLDLCDELVATDLVVYAEPNLVGTAHDDQVTPADTLYPRQWHVPLVHLPDAWALLRGLNAPGVVPGGPGDLTYGSENITIAVFDGGIPSQTIAGVVHPVHPDFTGPVTSGAPKISVYFDFVTMSPNNDSVSNRHGVRCAGLAAALADNPSQVPGDIEGVVGAAPNCPVMALIRDAGGSELQYADAYIWTGGFDPQSIEPGFPAPLPPGTGADVISNSFGLAASEGSPISGLMKDCFDYLTAHGRGGNGVVLCFSSGDDPIDFRLARPWAAYAKTIGVGASTPADTKSVFGGFGMGLDLCAPGGDGLTNMVTCDLPGNGNLAGNTGPSRDYTNAFMGTSASVPIVAGIAALVLSARPVLSWAAVRRVLITSAVKIDLGNTDPDGHWLDLNGDGKLDYSKWYGYGRVDAKAAVNAALTNWPRTSAPTAPTDLRIVR